MRRVSDYSEVKTLISLALRKRAITNCLAGGLLGSNALAAEAATGSLYLREWEGGVMLARRRRGFDLISLFVFDRSVSLPAPESDGVCEIVFDPRGRSGAEVLEELLLASGFAPSLRRMRLTSEKVSGAISPIVASTLGVNQLTAVAAFLETHFDSHFGCIPSLRTLSEELSAGCFHAVLDDDGIASLIHVNGNEIRHLATRNDRRGEGLAKALISHAVRCQGGKRMQVWCAEDNSAAVHTYTSCGFAPDGYRSLVLQYHVTVSNESKKILHLI